MSKPIRKKRQTWKVEEDAKLVDLVSQYGTVDWRHIAYEMESRDAKQCRERWMNHLDPMIDRSPFRNDEWELVEREHKMKGRCWSKMAVLLPGRTAYQIKNEWNARQRREKEKYNTGDDAKITPVIDWVKAQNIDLTSLSDIYVPITAPRTAESLMMVNSTTNLDDSEKLVVYKDNLQDPKGTGETLQLPLFPRKVDRSSLKKIDIENLLVYEDPDDDESQPKKRKRSSLHQESQKKMRTQRSEGNYPFATLLAAVDLFDNLDS